MEKGPERVQKLTLNEIPHDAVVGISIFRTNLEGKREVLLVQGATGKWHFPGGKMRPGESLEDCIRRELKEEVGITYTGALGAFSVDSYMINGVPNAIANVVAMDELKGEPERQEGDSARDFAWTSEPLNYDLTEQAFKTLANQMPHTMLPDYSDKEVKDPA